MDTFICFSSYSSKKTIFAVESWPASICSKRKLLRASQPKSAYSQRKNQKSNKKSSLTAVIIEKLLKIANTPKLIIPNKNSINDLCLLISKSKNLSPSFKPK